MSTEIDLAILVLTAVTFAMISGAYTALQLLSYGRTEKEANTEPARTSYIDRLLENALSAYISLGVARLVVLAAMVFAAHRFSSQHLPAGQTLGIAHFGFVTAVILLAFLLAKLVALRNPEGFIERSKFVTLPVTYLFRPVAYLAQIAITRISPELLDAVSFPILPLKKRIELFGYQNGDEETEEQILMTSVFDFGDIKVREVMIPRIDMVAVNINMNPADALKTIIDTGHSRVPVFDESIDRIVGIIHTKDLLHRIADGEDISLHAARRDTYFVPESKRIEELLGEFRKRRIHIAIVVDEYGGTAGLVTLEDILEELVGDIQDEFDAEEELIVIRDADTALCNARVRLDDLNETLGLELPDQDVDTLGGFLYETIGRVPRVGERIQHDDLEFQIESVVRQRIDNVLITGLSSRQKKIEDGLG